MKIVFKIKEDGAQTGAIADFTGENAGIRWGRALMGLRLTA